jgi:hypothetical protein
MLNGKSVFQRLVLDQGYYMDGLYTAASDEALINDIKLSMDAGFNGARLHQKVFEPRFLYHCDRLGYMVWGEQGNWGIDYSRSDALSYFLDEWAEVVDRDFNHPSIVGWCPWNEFWDNSRYIKDTRLIATTYKMTKAMDPTRVCIDTSGGVHTKANDICDVHDYNQDPVTFKENYDKLVSDNELYDQVNRGGVRQTWKGEPVFVSEYGGIGIHLEKNDSKKAWSYGNATRSLEEYYARYKGLTDALLDNPRILGFCYTQLTDVEQEQNGLFTYVGREPKFDVKTLYDINSRKAAIED